MQGLQLLWAHKHSVKVSKMSTSYHTNPSYHNIRFCIYPPLLGTLAVYNNSKRLLQNTLITDPRQIPNGLKCFTGRSGSPVNFEFENNTIMNVTSQGQNKTIQNYQLNRNGRYACTKSNLESIRPFYIYFNNGECYIEYQCRVDQARTIRCMYGNIYMSCYAIPGH